MQACIASMGSDTSSIASRCARLERGRGIAHRELDRLWHNLRRLPIVECSRQLRNFLLNVNEHCEELTEKVNASVSELKERFQMRQMQRAASRSTQHPGR
jgi:hypothetical protein